MTETAGARFKREAAAKGWTLAEFAAKVGVSFETARKWVTGETAPNRNRVPIIAKVLDRSEHWVLVGDQPLEKLPVDAGYASKLMDAVLALDEKQRASLLDEALRMPRDKIDNVAGRLPELPMKKQRGMVPIPAWNKRNHPARRSGDKPQKEGK